MAKRKEIKFRDRAGDLVGRQNGITFHILKDQDLGKTCAPAHSVAVYTNNGELQVSTGGRKYFHLELRRCHTIAGCFKMRQSPKNILHTVRQFPDVAGDVFEPTKNTSKTNGILPLLKLRLLCTAGPCGAVALAKQLKERLLRKAAAIQLENDLIHHILIDRKSVV